MANKPVRICSVTRSGVFRCNKLAPKLPKVSYGGKRERIYLLEDGQKPIKHNLKLQKQIEERNVIRKQAIEERDRLSKSRLHTLRVCKRVIPLILVKLNTYDTDNRISEWSKESSASL